MESVLSAVTKTDFMGGRVEQVVSDATVVLDHLKINQVSVLSVCAGTAFGLAMAIKCPARVKKTYVAVAPWVSPSDCQDTKLLYKIGVAAPSALVRGVASLLSPVQRLGFSVPSSVFEAGFMSNLSKTEQSSFKELGLTGETMQKIIREMNAEAGGMAEEVDVLLRPSSEWGVDYAALQQQFRIFHGTRDEVVPMSSADWFSKQVSSAKLTVVEDGTHTGILLGPTMRQALQVLKQADL